MKSSGAGRRAAVDDATCQKRLLHVRCRTSYGNMDVMARKKKIKRFGAVQAVKELARERMGAPPVEKVVPHKNKKADKHKPTLGKLLEEAE
jgi:Holliday junction resolvase-like predicted endonuclease